MQVFVQALRSSTQWKLGWLILGRGRGEGDSILMRMTNPYCTGFEEQRTGETIGWKVLSLLGLRDSTVGNYIRRYTGSDGYWGN